MGWNSSDMNEKPPMGLGDCAEKKKKEKKRTCRKDVRPPDNDQNYHNVADHRFDRRKRIFESFFCRDPNEETRVMRYRSGQRKSVRAEAKEESPRGRNYTGTSVSTCNSRSSNKEPRPSVTLSFRLKFYCRETT